MRHALSQKGKGSLEARRRMERILALHEIGLATGPDNRLRLLRALEVLAHIGNADARATLGLVAKQGPTADAAQLARAALDRLQKAAP